MVSQMYWIFVRGRRYFDVGLLRILNPYSSDVKSIKEGLSQVKSPLPRHHVRDAILIPKQP